MKTRILGLGLAALLALAPASARAQGGPPLLTDDPDTPGPGYWEINVSTSLVNSEHERRFEVPRVDLNYGVGKRIQLKFEMPWAGARETGEPVRTGAGNAVAGVKWRFVGQEGQRLAWSIYPQAEFNTAHSSVEKDLVEDGSQFLLPTEITLELGHVEFNGEIGRTFVQHGMDEWLYGIATEAAVHPRLELLAEIHGEHLAGGDPNQLVVNFGGREKITRRLVLMIAAGRGLTGAPEERAHLLLYAGLQVNIPGIYTFERPAPPRPHQ